MLSVTEAVAQRWSCRAFKPDALTAEQITDLIDKARRSPSGGNLQPWRILAVAGEEKEKLRDIAAAVLLANPDGEEGEQRVYPSNLEEPYRSRRYKVGEDMYEALGIARDDKMGRYGWLANNYSFFGAPVGLFFIIKKRFGHHQWAHMGMLMQTIALLAQEAGFATCMQEAWSKVRETLHTELNLADDEMLYCGMALGVPDHEAAVNQWRSDRAPLADILECRGF